MSAAKVSTTDIRKKSPHPIYLIVAKIKLENIVITKWGGSIIFATQK